MRKITVLSFITLDGVSQAPGGPEEDPSDGFKYGGWTAPAPGSHHYPETKGGAIIALFFLPAGRIAYNIKAPDAN